MADQWFNNKTGQSSIWDPTMSDKDLMSWVKVPDPHLSYKSAPVVTDYGPPKECTQFQKSLARAFGFLFISAVIVVISGIILFAVWRSIDAHFSPISQMIAGSAVYGAESIEKYSRLPWNQGKLFQIHGGDAIIAGDLVNVNVESDGNLTVRGDVIGSALKSLHGYIKVGNARDSTLTASRIIVTGKAINTKKNLWIVH